VVDTYDSLELARLFKVFRDALSIAFVVCALFFREELVAVILYIAEEHAHKVLEEFLEVLNIDVATSS